MVPVVSFIGRHNSGKTTILEKVVSYFCAQGYRIGVIKHSSHDFTIDVPDTDSYRLAKPEPGRWLYPHPRRWLYKQVQRDYPWMNCAG